MAGREPRGRGKSTLRKPRTWVPHVFRKMWECATIVPLFKSVMDRRLPNEHRAFPHLAKNVRDMGHPRPRVCAECFLPELVELRGFAKPGRERKHPQMSIWFD